MGREIEKIALETGDNILFRLNHTEDWDNAGKALKKGDAIIDFSWPDTARWKSLEILRPLLSLPIR